MKRLLPNALASLLLLTGCATGWKARYTADSAQELLHRVRKHVPTVVLADVANPTSLAGHYTSGSGLSGSELYLFPDRTYMYAEWADILRETLYDRGTWSCSEGFVRLSSDKPLSKLHPRDKVYVGLQYDGTHLSSSFVSEELRIGVLLMGTNWHYSMYMDFIQTDLDEGWKSQDVFEGSLLTCTLKKTDEIRAQDVDEMKRSLSKGVWTPHLED